MPRFFPLLLLLIVQCVLSVVQADTVGPVRSFPSEEVLVGHTAPVDSVDYSPDGRFIVSGSHDKTLKIWDAESGTEIRTLTGHVSHIRVVAWSPDGRFILSGSGVQERLVKVWDATSGTEL